MTTIVYRDGVLATDSRMRLDDGTHYTGTKIHKTPSGVAAFAVTGDMGPFTIEEVGGFIDDYILNDGGSSFYSLNMLVMTREWGMKVDYGNIFLSPDLNFYYFGSGMYFARAALFNGASAKEAVEFAIANDPGTLGPVEYLLAKGLKTIKQGKAHVLSSQE